MSKLQHTSWRAKARQTTIHSCPVPRLGVEIIESGECDGYEPIVSSPLQHLDYLFYAGPSPKDRVSIYRHRFSSADDQAGRQAVVDRLMEEGFVLMAIVHVARGATSIGDSNITNLTKEDYGQSNNL